jgi:hypothetical protein
MKKQITNILELPLEERAEIALRVAVKNVIAERARAGLPIYVWRDGKVLEISPEELRQRSASTQKE